MNTPKCVFGTVTVILGAIVFITGIIPMLKYYDYDKTTCQVTQIDYPKVLPNINYTDNWKECRCGRRCSAMTPCINIYVKILEEDTIYLAKKDVDSIKKKCTFYHRLCKDNDNILNLYKDLEEAKDIYNKYNNKTINCYYSNNSVVLENNYDWTILIVLSGFTGVCLCCFICSLCDKDK
jgi:hypothetical protein